jgi:cytochrome c
MPPTKAVIVLVAVLVAWLGAIASNHFSGASAAPEPPLAALLAKADAAAGEADVRPCRPCHSFERSAVAKVGPPLYGVVGRPVASIAGFRYSAAMKALGGEWTYDRLERLLADPSVFLAGTRMSFPGEPDAQKRADILAYLRTLSDNPVPFPP